MKYKTLFIFFLLVWAFPLIPLSTQYSDFIFDQHTGLLLVDIQNFYFPGGTIPLDNSEAASLRAGKILEKFRMKGMLVVHIKHEPRTKNGIKKGLDSGWDIHQNVSPKKDEKVFVKHGVNSFKETGLYEYLKKNKIHRLVICGMQTHMCLEAAVRAASDLGFSVMVIHDACATRNLEFQGTFIPSHLVHASTIAALQAGYAQILSSDQLFLKLNK